jgi:hypothetical protein
MMMMMMIKQMMSWKSSEFFEVQLFVRKLQKRIKISRITFFSLKKEKFFFAVAADDDLDTFSK